jgi:small subunit ribosomal protein S4
MYFESTLGDRMGRYTGPKNRIARRFGENIFGRKRNPLVHRPTPPGVHGARRRKKSDFGLQLNEKQKLKAVYGMLREKQLKRYYQHAVRRKENTGTVLIQSLECRLDNIVYRLKLAPTIFAAQQLVAHGHVQVDGKKVDIRSFQVKPGMLVSIREKSRNMAIIKEALENSQRTVPEYLNLEANNFSGTLMALPEIESIDFPVEINVPVICDFLAHTS